MQEVITYIKDSLYAHYPESEISGSAKNKINIDELKEKVYARVKEIHIERYPYNDFLFQKYDEETE